MPMSYVQVANYASDVEFDLKSCTRGFKNLHLF